MKRQLTQRELRNNSGDVMRALDRGETLIVTCNGVGVGELVPIRSRSFVSAEVVVAAFKGAPTIDWTTFRLDVDRYLDQDLQPRG